mgnify:FL=1|tara:strand:+ start:410 stop:1978 length:1569 start_codon:yes stop_codon:yes gene_type:complete
MWLSWENYSGIQWGITANAHDASLTVTKDNDILFAAHAERTSGIKFDPVLNQEIIDQAMEFGDPRCIHWYETSWLKRIRQIYAKQWKTAWKKPGPHHTLLKYGFNGVDNGIDDWDDSMHLDLRRVKLFNHRHHRTHASAGYYTSSFNDAAVLVIDSIGEFETLTIWKGEGTKLVKVYSQSYPHSVGLWYSAMTQRIGLKPNEEEYILMGWSALGDPEKYADKIWNDFFYPLTDEFPHIKLKHNLHRGCRWWAPELNTIQDYADIAAGTQAVYEKIFKHLLLSTKKMVHSNNLVIMGGCALNCVANTMAHDIYKNVWIMPNPGDAGSSLGAILSARKDFIEWNGPYLGYDIKGKYPVNGILNELKTNRLVGCANGKAEFGPRALGNRTLFADPRGKDVKDLVNTVKKREEFRPFAPVIKQEKLHDYFDCNFNSSPYMQYIGKTKDPDSFPAITHLDGTSRIQTVTRKQHKGLYELLDKWESATGCPMLLNTSLNIKGEPMVDSEEDAKRWQDLYKVKVLTKEI